MSFWGGIDTPSPFSIRLASASDVPMVYEHLRTHYGDPPRTAPYSPQHRASILFLAFDGDRLMGCIRYRYVDHAENEEGRKPIHLVDCFCVHPEARGRGCATALLMALRDYATPRGMPCALFLKEGAPLAHPPMASGRYWYRGGLKGFGATESLMRCPTSLAHRLVAAYQSVKPSLILLAQNAPQQWWLYRSPTVSVLACIQDTEQRLLNGERMAWFTAWIPWIRSANEEDMARNAIADALAPEYGAVWFPSLSEWTDPTWKEDGAFHWYTYQWSAAHKIDQHAYVMIT